MRRDEGARLACAPGLRGGRAAHRATCGSFPGSQSAYVYNSLNDFLTDVSDLQAKFEPTPRGS
jgi:hypothetical protein